MTDENALTEKNVMDKLNEVAEIAKRDGIPIGVTHITRFDKQPATPLEALDILHRYSVESHALNPTDALNLMRIVRTAFDVMVVNKERLVEIFNNEYTEVFNASHELEPINQSDGTRFHEKRYKINGKTYAFYWYLGLFYWPSIYEVIPA